MVIYVRGEKSFYWTFKDGVTVETAVNFLVARSHALGGLHCEPVEGDVFEGKQAVVQDGAAELYHEKGGE